MNQDAMVSIHIQIHLFSVGIEMPNMTDIVSRGMYSLRYIRHQNICFG